METQATRSSLAHKVIAVAMAIVLAVGLCPMLPYGAAPAYADDLATGQIATQADETTTDATTPATLADGTYTVTGLTSSLSMYHFDAAQVTVKVEGEKAWLNTTITEANTIDRYDGMASGKASEIIDANDAAKLVDGTQIATISEEKDAEGNVTSRTFALPVDKDVILAGGTIDYTLKYSSTYSKSLEQAGKWYAGSKGGYYFSDYKIWAELPFTNNVSMFSVTSAELSTDGTQVRITMKNDNHSKVALCKERKIEDDTTIYPVTDKVVVLPATELGGGKRITTSWYTKDWYERDITFDAKEKTLTFDTTVKAVDVIDALKDVAGVNAAIADESLVVTPELVDDMIAAIQVQVRDEKTDFYCEAAKILWNKLSAAEQDEVEEGGYFADPTGDAAKDDPLNADNIGEKEILVVSFGTSFNDSRAATIGGVEKALAKAFPDWSVRRAFTAQIIINHIQSRDGVKIDNVQQAMDRAVANGVKNMIVQPTHLMHGAEYDELKGEIDKYADKMTITYAEPLLGAKVKDTVTTNPDKEIVAKAAVAAMAKDAGFADAAAADKAGTAFVFMGHGTAHEANDTYFQMQKQMEELGYKNVFVGTVEGEELGNDTACSVVLGKVKAAGYKNVILRPLMVVAGDHANNDMADPDDEESWYSQFKADGSFTKVDCQIKGLGEIDTVQQLYVAHTANLVPGHKIAEPAAATGLTYTGKTLTGVKAGANYTLSNATATNAGTYTATAKVASGYVWSDNGTNIDKIVRFTIAPAAAKANVTKAKTIKVKKLKKKAQTFAIAKLTTDGKATYKVTKNKSKKVLSFKNGKVTVKKGAKKGTYSITVKVGAKAGKNYKALKAKAYTVKVTVK